jgi:tetratricopeptide (TPR) repeat protein
MFKKIKNSIISFLRGTATGNLVINIVAAALFLLLVFLIGFYLNKSGFEPLSKIAERILNNILSIIAPYLKYVLTVIITIGVVVIYSIIRKRTRRSKALALRRPILKSSAGFVGREQEISNFVSLLTGKSSEPVHVIYGMSGSGKTWLVNRLLEESQKLNCLTANVDFRGATYTHIALINEISLQLGYEQFPIFKESLSEYALLQQQFQSKFELIDKSIAAIIAQKDEETVLSFFSDLKKLSTKHKIVIAFDTYEKLKGQELASWITRRLLLSIRERIIENVCVIISGWDNLSLGSDWSSIIFSQHLSNLSLPEIRECLELELGRGNVDDNLLGELFKLTGNGHPLFVGLVSTILSQAKDEGADNSLDVLKEREAEFKELAVADLLMERILRWIPSEAANAIRLCAIPRWFDGTVLREALGIQASQLIIEQLVSYRSFIRPHRPYGYEYHEIVRDLLLAKWQNEDRGQYLVLNKNLANYYRSILEAVTTIQDRERAVLELLYHSSIAEPQSALSIFQKYMDEAIGYYNSELAEQLILEAKHSLRQKNTIPWVEFFEGQLAYLRGRWKETERVCLKLIHTGESDTSLLALSCNALGQIYYYQGEFENAIRFYRKSESLVGNPTDNNDLAGEIFENLAKAYRNIGELKEAEDSHKKALSIAESRKEEQKIATVSVDMATTFTLQGKWEEAIQSCALGLDTFSRTNNKRSLGRTLRNLAWAQMYSGNFEEAAQSSSRALNLAEEIHDHYNIGIGYLNLGRISQLNENWSDGISHYSKALDILRPLGAETDIGSAFEGLATCTRDSDKWAESLDYYKRSIKIFREIGYRYGLSLCLNNWAERYYELCEYDNAGALFTESEEVARQFQIHYWRGKALLGLLTIELDKLPFEQAKLDLRIELDSLIHTYNFYDLSSLFSFAVASNELIHKQKVTAHIIDFLLASLVNSDLYNTKLFRKIIDKIDVLIKNLILSNKVHKAVQICMALSSKLLEIETNANIHAAYVHFSKLAEDMDKKLLDRIKTEQKVDIQ